MVDEDPLPFRLQEGVRDLHEALWEIMRVITIDKEKCPAIENKWACRVCAEEGFGFTFDMVMRSGGSMILHDGVKEAIKISRICPDKAVVVE